MSHLEALQHQIQFHYQRIQQSRVKAQYHVDHYLDPVKAHFQQKVTDAQQQIQTTHQWAILPWGASEWQNYTPATNIPIPTYIRVGHFMPAELMGLGDLPAFAPFITQGSLFLQSSDPKSSIEPFLCALALRFTVSVSPKNLRLVLVDPTGAGANLAAFLHLPETLRGNKVWVEPNEIAQQIDALKRHIETVIQTRLLNLYATVEEYNQKVSEVAIPYHLLVLNNFPAGFNDYMAEGLLYIAKNGPRAGVYILAALNSRYEPPRDFKLAELFALGTTLSLTPSNHLLWDKAPFAPYTILADLLPQPAMMNGLLQQIGDFNENLPTHLEFSRIRPSPSQQWTGDTQNGLSIPIAINSAGQIHPLRLGQGVVHHGLIGGITQSGKTNLLHVIITQLALHYPPNELELYLVDFKEGVEFADYLHFHLPHVRVIGLESDREFGLSILRYLRLQMEKRGQLFKQVRVSRLDDFRQKQSIPMPRILLILDEYQLLFAEADRLAEEAEQLLEDIARRGAAFGIHLILASQSPSGSGFSYDRIYNQMALRIALQCRPRDAQAILGDGNEAASQLERAGEAIYNDDRGLVERNVFMRVAYLPIGERLSILAHIQKLTAKEEYQTVAPVTFEGGAKANLTNNPIWQDLLKQPYWGIAPASASLWLGEPIEIKSPTAVTIERQIGSNLLVLGDREEDVYGVFVASLLSLATQYPPKAVRFVVADFSRPPSPWATLFSSLKVPHDMAVVGARQANVVLQRLMGVLNQRLRGGDDKEPIYFFVLGLHRWRELRSSDPYDPSEVALNLTQLADQGPEVGVHLLVWSDSLGTLLRLSRQALQYFDLRVAFRIFEDDSQAALGNRLAASLPDNRAFLRDENWEVERLEKFKPYTLPDRITIANFEDYFRTKATKTK